MTVFVPSPWKPPHMPFNSNVGRELIFSGYGNLFSPPVNSVKPNVCFSLSSSKPSALFFEKQGLSQELIKE
jgi:hypothetical protein